MIFNKNVKEDIRIGFVGCGQQAMENLLPALRTVETVRLVSICDTDATRSRMAAKLHGAEYSFTNIDDLVQTGEVDALILCGPPQMHLQCARVGLDNGLHVFTEKPPTLYTKDLELLATIASSRKLVTAVGHNFRYSKSFGVLNSFASEPSFGRPIRFDVWFVSGKPRTPIWGEITTLRTFLLAMAIHPIDLVVSRFGMPDKITVIGGPENRKENIFFTVLFFYGKDRLATLTTGNGAAHFQIDIKLTSDTGKFLALDSLWNLRYKGFDWSDSIALEGVANRSSLQWSPSPVDSGYSRAGYSEELRAFVNAINGEGTFYPSFSDEVLIYSLIDEIERQLEILDFNETKNTKK